MTFLKTLQDVKAHKNIYQNTTCSTQGQRNTMTFRETKQYITQNTYISDTLQHFMNYNNILAIIIKFSVNTETFNKTRQQFRKQQFTKHHISQNPTIFNRARQHFNGRTFCKDNEISGNIVFQKHYNISHITILTKLFFRKHKTTRVREM